jgi:hypothetical protein
MDEHVLNYTSFPMQCTISGKGCHLGRTLRLCWRSVRGPPGAQKQGILWPFLLYSRFIPPCKYVGLSTRRQLQAPRTKQFGTMITSTPSIYRDMFPSYPISNAAVQEGTQSHHCLSHYFIILEAKPPQTHGMRNTYVVHYKNLIGCHLGRSIGRPSSGPHTYLRWTA